MSLWNTIPFVGLFLKGFRVRCAYIPPSREEKTLGIKGEWLMAEGLLDVLLNTCPRRDDNILNIPLVSDCKGNWFPVDMLMLEDFHACTKVNAIWRELETGTRIFCQSQYVPRHVHLAKECVGMINAPRRKPQEPGNENTGEDEEGTKKKVRRIWSGLRFMLTCDSMNDRACLVKLLRRTRLSILSLETLQCLLCEHGGADA